MGPKMKMYLLLNMVIFQPAMLGSLEGTPFLGKSTGNTASSPMETWAPKDGSHLAWTLRMGLELPKKN